jgi:hypothetical protein
VQRRGESGGIGLESRVVPGELPDWGSETVRQRRDAAVADVLLLRRPPARTIRVGAARSALRSGS